MAAPEMSTKNTKNEILDAYQSVLQQLQESKKISKQSVQHEQEKQVIVNSASQHTADEIINNLASLKLFLGKSLETLENQLLSEHKKLTELQRAIAWQTKELEDTHEIKINADTLAALLQAQQQRKEAFERKCVEQLEAFQLEMSQKRMQWKKELEETERFTKEQATLQKTLRQREEEEYSYKRDLERQKEGDRYTVEKEALEKELMDKRALLEKEFAQREADVTAKEQELEHLRVQVAGFPRQLEQAVAETEKVLTERLQFQYDYEAKLMHKEVEGERKLYQLQVTGLEAKLIQQEQHINALTERANQAGIQVQDIAVKAIEGAARQQFYPVNYLEKNKIGD